MATPLRGMRLDDDVWAEVLKLRAVYGTDNAAMRFAFNLPGTAKVTKIERVAGKVPKVIVKKMPPDLTSESAITKLDDKSLEYTRRGPRQKGDKSR